MDNGFNSEIKETAGDVLGLCLTGLTWLVAPLWLSMPLTVYMIKNCERNEKMQKEKKERVWEDARRLSEELTEELTNPKTDSRPDRTADEFFPYKGCVVEVFRYPKFTARVLGQDGRDIGRSFEGIAEAVNEIEEHTPEPAAPKEQGIRNIRIVK